MRDHGGRSGRDRRRGPDRGYSGGGEAVFVGDDRFTLRNTAIVDNDGGALTIDRNSDEFSIDRNEIRRNDAGIVDGDSWYPPMTVRLRTTRSKTTRVSGSTLQGRSRYRKEQRERRRRRHFCNRIRFGNLSEQRNGDRRHRHPDPGDSVVVDNTIEDAEWGSTGTVLSPWTDSH